MTGPDTPLELHLLGHAFVSRGGQPVAVSAKGVALLTYLSLERRPFHREHLAGLLWSSPDAPRNLRVELNRMRHLLPGLIPERQPMLSVALPTDLDLWIRRGQDLDPDEVGDWLSLAAGLPLSGLEDLGSAELGVWVDSQRWQITQTIETHLGAAHARLTRAGQTEAAALITARAARMGWEIHARTEESGDVIFGVPPSPVLRQVLADARRRPQIVVLDGRSAQARLQAVTALAGTAWDTVDIACPPEPELLLVALAHQLSRFQSLESGILHLLDTPAGDRGQIVRLWTQYLRAERPLIVVFNDITDVQALLPHLHVALNIPMDLVLVLCPADPGVRRTLLEATASIDPGRMHVHTLPPLGVGEVMDALSPRQRNWPDDLRYACAARLVMDSDGWEPLLRTLWREQEGAHAARVPYPQSTTELLLRELGALPRELIGTLARLALAHAPLDAHTCAAVIEDAPETLSRAETLGLLVPCDPVETVQFPQLHHRPSDQGETLCFKSESLRVALASTLSRRERQVVRRQLAQAVGALDPPLAAHYARLAGDEAPEPRVARSLRTLSGVAPPPADPAPPWPRGIRRECRTGNGYRVLGGGGSLQILRRGLYGRPVTLRILLGALPAGPWQLTARIDALRGGPVLGPQAGSYALSWQLGGDAVLVGTSPALEVPVGSGPSIYYAAPAGQWFTLRGHGAGGPGELRVHAMDVAVTVAALRVMHLPIIAPDPWSERRVHPPAAP